MQDFIFKYHEELTNHFKDQKKTWDWFSSSKVQVQQLKEHKQEILKNSYRLSRDSEESVYKLVDEAKEKLNISKEVTLYQEMDSLQVNASVSYFENEVHIVLSGELLRRLNESELLAVIGHELTHVLFYTVNEGQFEITNRIITSIANDSRSDKEMIETARLYRLYMELLCDRGALRVVGHQNTVIEALVKISTGLTNVSAENYLKQAREIFEEEKFGSAQQTHPETFIRARALEMWQNGSTEEEVIKLIDHHWGLSNLDVFKQKRLHLDTKRFIQIITKPKWIRTELIFSLCRQYYPDFSYSDDLIIDDTFHQLIEETDDTIREYFCYVLMDYCFADSSLEAAPVGHAFQISEELAFQKTFRQVLKKELKVGVKELDKFIQKGVAEVSQLNESEEESILKDE